MTEIWRVTCVRLKNQLSESIKGVGRMWEEESVTDGWAEERAVDDDSGALLRRMWEKFRAIANELESPTCPQCELNIRHVNAQLFHTFSASEELNLYFISYCLYLIVFYFLSRYWSCRENLWRNPIGVIDATYRESVAIIWLKNDFYISWCDVI